MDWGNLVFGGFVIAQIVPGDSSFKILAFGVGLASLIAAYYVAYLLTK